MFCAPLYPVSAGAGPIRFWRDFLADKSDDVGSVVEFSTIPGDPDYPEQYWGERVYTIAAVLRGRRRRGRASTPAAARARRTVADFSGQMGYCDIQQLFDTLMPFGQYRAYWKSHYLSGLEDDAIDLDPRGQCGSAVAQHALVDLELRRRNGARRGCGHGLRRPLDAVHVVDRFDLGAPEDDEANIAWTRAFWERMRPYSDRGRIYLNFPGLGEEGDELVRRSYGANFARLAEIKRRFDPRQHCSASTRTSSPAESRSRADGNARRGCL